ncbi:IS200/IS605 family element transposase accessory protein TnpB [Halosegnis rubeus]|uniref:IS200/IS605 family element transposase accessory protein TnpB n=1 Tax=Halosegnis rubeus TaxID=2212850 RepID=A0A5N5U8Q2_9EURY|nr:RNA-guided endonuclease TnpB family protein [Halosegnis rubeus]KAB7514954.1 IS200/IS605 family element transposase accessory protein TnpB [Halosegnis rubeus]
MDYVLKYRLFPDGQQRERLDWVRDTVRQVYNHALHRFNRIPEDAGTVKQRVTQVRDELPELKDWWTDLNNVYSTVLQQAVEQIETNITNLAKRRDAGYDVGSLNWKAPHEYRSFTYRQTGFELDDNSGPSGRGLLTLKKVNGETLQVPIRLHRDLLDETDVKHVTIKKDRTGAWFACLNVEQAEPDKPDPAELDTKDTVGLDLGILNFIHDSDRRQLGRLDLSSDRERLEHEQRNLSRKQHGSNNWEEQRQTVAKVHKRMRNKKSDFKHKVAAFYTTEYDAVFVENLNVKGMLESGRNSRNTHEIGWRDFITILKHHGRKRGCHVVEVDPKDTTKACNECGVKTDKPLWVREHSCPSCGYTTDRDYNAALNVWERGLEKLGVVHSEDRTPAETATAVEQTHRESVSASRVVETGSPCLKEATQSVAE